MKPAILKAFFNDFCFSGCPTYSYTQQDSIAINYLEKVLEIDPKQGLAKNRLSGLYTKTGDYEKMRVLIEDWLTEDSVYWIYLGLADYYALTDRFEEGINRLKRAWEFFPDNFWIPHSIAGLYIIDEEYDEAEKVLNEAAKIDTSHDARSWRFGEFGGLYLYTGEYRKALKVADQAIEWGLNNSDIGVAANFYLFKAVAIIFGWGDNNAAHRHVKEASRLEHPYHSLQAYSSILTGDNKGAEKAYAEEGRKIGSSMKTLMDIQEEKCQQAIEAVNTILNEGGRLGLLLAYHLSFCYLDQGQMEKAIDALRQVQVKRRYHIPRIWLRPFYYPKSFYGLGKIYEQQGDTRRAIENYEKFLDLWKNADADLPDLIDAKARYAKLKGMSKK